MVHSMPHDDHDEHAHALLPPEPALRVKALETILVRKGLIDPAAVDAIVHLVSSSVPFMAKNDVTVVDQHGNLLSRPPQDSAGMLSDAQLEHRIRLEDIYRNRVIALVSPIVGAGNVTAQVNLEMDFTRSEVTEEVVDPEGNALRSEQRSTESTSEMNARGIPGATTNRAPTQTEMESQQGNDADSSALKNR